MITRKELEEILGYKLTDEQWAETQKQLDDIADRMYEEDHPLDD